jgi:diacylglycerol O-acyltransferase
MSGMPQQHLDRLSPTDVSFLHMEEGGAHMHIGGIALIAGPPPAQDAVEALIASRIHLVPRYRQKLAYPPAGAGRPWWVDDPFFNLDYHLRRTALPAPGGEEQLHRLVGRIMSQPLDRNRPLWELWVVEGLADGRFALISKNHHALVDGVAGLDLTATVFDLEPVPGEVPPDTWQPTPAPGAAGLVTRQVGDVTAKAAGLVTRLARVAVSPERWVHTAEEVGRAVVDGGRMLLAAAPHTSLNVRPGPHRRYTVVRTRLADYKAVKDTFGGTVNDVVLTVVAAALGRFLAARGDEVAGQTLRACVPVSVRTEDRRGHAGNEITIMVAPLPIAEQDPVQRLRTVSAAMHDLKRSKQALSAQLIAQAEYFAPPNILARASRLAFSPRLYNLLVTNVPGPQFPLYLLGRELQEAFPIAFLAPAHTVAVAVLSYRGAVNVGLLADFDAVPDLDRLAKEIDAALGELVARAG